MGKKAPQPTDPRETSAATTGSNVSTSVANAFMQNMNEYGPDGTKTFDQTGSTTITSAPMPMAAAAVTRPMVPPPETTTRCDGFTPPWRKTA